MKHILIVFLLVCLAPVVFAVNSLDAFQGTNSNQLVMAIRDDGVLFSLSRTGWDVVGEPCPGIGPFSLQLNARIDCETEALVFVIDHTGKLFQTNGEQWFEIIEAPEAASTVSFGTVFRMTGEFLQAVVLDDQGNMFLNESYSSWVSPFETIPAAPPRDMSFHYDSTTDTMNSFIIGSDGKLYGFFNGGWESADSPESQWNIQNLESYVDTATGGILLVAFDDQGRMYSNSASEQLALANHEPCPGEGPWDIELLHIGKGNFDLFCLDSTGRLFLAYDDSWSSVADAFPRD